MAAVEKFDPILMDNSGPVLDVRSATRQIRQGNGASSRARIVAPTAMQSGLDHFLKHRIEDILTKLLKKFDLLTPLGAKEHAPLPRGYVLGGPCPYGRNL